MPQRALVPASLRRDAARLLARHGELVTELARLFGPYPFDAYTLVFTDDDLEIPVEAQGISIFGANHVDPADGEERLVPHELAHQWFGNSVSVATWQHIWLNEGFACYAEWLWSPHAGGPATDALARTWHQRLAAQDEDLVLADPGPENIFDDRVYKRGALTLHALRLHPGRRGLLRAGAGLDGPVRGPQRHDGGLPRPGGRARHRVRRRGAGPRGRGPAHGLAGPPRAAGRSPRAGIGRAGIFRDGGASGTMPSSSAARGGPERCRPGRRREPS